MSFIVAGVLAGAAMSYYQKRQQTDNQIAALMEQKKIAEQNGRQAKTESLVRASQTQMFGDLEETRMRRMNQFQTGKMAAQMGGSGAVAGSGTTWNVVLSQKANNETSVNNHKYSVDTQIGNMKYEGQKAYDSWMSKANGFDQQQQFLRDNYNQSMLTSLVTGGISGGMQGSKAQTAWDTVGGMEGLFGSESATPQTGSGLPPINELSFVSKRSTGGSRRRSTGVRDITPLARKAPSLTRSSPS